MAEARRWIAVALLLAAMPAWGQADDPVVAGVRQLVQDDARLTAVGHRLALVAADLCPVRGPQLGFAVSDAQQYGGEFRAAAVRVLGAGGAPVVEAVAPGSAAARAGLTAGDRLAAIDGVAVTAAAPSGAAAIAPLLAVRATLDRDAADGTVTLTVERGGERRTVAFAPERGCAIRFQVRPAGNVNAGNDGRIVTVTSAMVEATPDDDTLAMVVAHELAHSIFGDSPWRAGVPDPGEVPVRIVRSRRAEDRADRAALWLMAAAGYRLDGVPAFWRALGRRWRWRELLSDGSHASGAARARAAEAEIATIRAAPPGRPTLPPDLAPLALGNRPRGAGISGGRSAGPG